MAIRTQARTAAFMPCESPPLVKTARPLSRCEPRARKRWLMSLFMLLANFQFAKLLVNTDGGCSKNIPTGQVVFFLITLHNRTSDLIDSLEQLEHKAGRALDTEALNWTGLDCTALHWTGGAAVVKGEPKKETQPRMNYATNAYAAAAPEIVCLCLRDDFQ